MIREVVYDFIALIVFTLGGIISSLPLLRIYEKGNLKFYLLDLVLGILPAPVFIVLTEIFFEGVITHFTIICFIIGYFFTLLFFSTSVTKKKEKVRKKIQSKTIKKSATKKRSKFKINKLGNS